jgi:hypothetical protein
MSGAYESPATPALGRRGEQLRRLGATRMSRDRISRAPLVQTNRETMPNCSSLLSMIDARGALSIVVASIWNSVTGADGDARGDVAIGLAPDSTSAIRRRS